MKLVYNYNFDAFSVILFPVKYENEDLGRR